MSPLVLSLHITFALAPNNGSTMMRFVGVGDSLAPNVPQVVGLENLRNSSNSSYAVVGDDLWLHAFSSANGIQFSPADVSTVTLWFDPAPLSGASTTSGLTVTTVDSGGATGDSSRGQIGAVAMNGQAQFSNVNSGRFDLDASYRGAGYRLTVEYFIPTDTTFDDPDRLYLQMNFNRENSATAGFIGLDGAGTGWNTVTLDGTVPNNAITATPLFIIRDGAGTEPPNGTGSGVAVYIDDITFTIDVPNPLPFFGADKVEADDAQSERLDARCLAQPSLSDCHDVVFAETPKRQRYASMLEQLLPHRRSIKSEQAERLTISRQNVQADDVFRDWPKRS